jgi:hypothetical protein
MRQKAERRSEGPRGAHRACGCVLCRGGLRVRVRVRVWVRVRRSERVDAIIAAPN